MCGCVCVMNFNMPPEDLDVPLSKTHWWGNNCMDGHLRSTAV